MGGTGSTRKVSFGLDDQDRVRVLRGVRLSEDVVSRMKDAQQPAREQSTSTSSMPTSRSFSSESIPSVPEAKPYASSTGWDSQKPSSSAKNPSDGEEDLYRRYEIEQAIIQEELARLAKKERESARENLSILREKNLANEERKKAAQMAKELERKEAELKRLDEFHKGQLARIEKKNTEIYKLTTEQFHTAATNAELRVKPRSYDPVCKGLQSQILNCYQENRQEVLNCSDLAKEYRRCVSDAQKTLLVNHG
ncbi:MICOS complex subunit MIC25 isoform X2 [Pleurodeles waltl]|uniref:MICOS complex subunit MIC25 isoform X2 n=1 Tax=Pleurodeles waltl TaxID=8319 RepID=UPI003709518B